MNGLIEYIYDRRPTAPIQYLRVLQCLRAEEKQAMEVCRDLNEEPSYTSIRRVLAQLEEMHLVRKDINKTLVTYTLTATARRLLDN